VQGGDARPRGGASSRRQLRGARDAPAPWAARGRAAVPARGSGPSARGPTTSGRAMMDKPPSGANEDFWRDFLTHGDPRERRNRAIYRHIPSNPRCRLCAAPFGGVGRPLMRVLGKQPAQNNPNLCGTCFTFINKNHGGAEIPMSMLFADVRGSTAMAERMPSGEYQRLLGHFYDAAAKAVFDNDGFLDKFVGDEVIALFVPLL